jgi:hypothetical protein
MPADDEKLGVFYLGREFDPKANALKEDLVHKLLVSVSNRFGAAEQTQALVVVDTGKFSRGSEAVLGKIAAGALPREMRITPDDETLLVVNSISRRLQVIDLARMGELMMAR